MYRFFSDHPQIDRLLRSIGVLMLANALWILVSIPLITLPASTAGLFATVGPLSRGHIRNPIIDFFHGLKSSWMYGSLVSLVDAVVIGIAGVNLFWIHSSALWLLVARIVSVIVGLVTIMTNLYAWPLLVTFKMPFKTLISTSVRLTLGYFLWSLLVLVASLIPIITASYITFLIPIAVFSLSAYVASWGSWRVIRAHVRDTDLARLEGEFVEE